MSLTSTERRKQIAIDSINSFAFKLYRVLAEQKRSENIFFSPGSIVTALAMVFTGAKGETARQLAHTLGFTVDPSQVGDICSAFNGWLEDYRTATNVKTAVANRLWIDESFEAELSQPFVEQLENAFKAGVKIADFMKHPDTASQRINNWVSDITNGMIDELVTADAVSQAVLVLTNAIYFKSDWEKKFNKRYTDKSKFTGLTETKFIDHMNQKQSFYFSERNGTKSISLPYDNNGFKMVAILPEDIESFERGLDYSEFKKFVRDQRKSQVVLTLPKFEDESEMTLSEQLQALGSTVVFSADADLTSINPGGRKILVSEVIHKAKIIVDEEGTEAAAATAVRITRSYKRPEPTVEFIADKPFIYAIVDDNDAIVFLGRYVNPK